LSGLF